MSRILRTPHGTVWARIAIVAAVAGSAAAGLLSATAAGRRATTARLASVFALANRCVALKALGNRRFVAPASASTYAASATTITGSSRFFLKATGLGTY